MRYFALLQYDGSAYHGWQVQTNAPSVQETVEAALATCFRVPTPVVGCGRTDTGVHAHGYFLHFDTETAFDLDTVVFKLNTLLPKDIAIQRIVPVHSDAHARFDATSRRYQYRLHKHKDPFANCSAKVHYELDLAAMNQAAKHLLEVRDFGAFCKSGSDVQNTLCTVTESQWHQEGEGLVYSISANRFLRNMVRAAVGTQVDVGRGYTSFEEFKEILATGQRSQAGMSAAAVGLSLVEVRYPFLGG